MLTFHRLGNASLSPKSSEGKPIACCSYQHVTSPANRMCRSSQEGYWRLSGLDWRLGFRRERFRQKDRRFRAAVQILERTLYIRAFRDSTVGYGLVNRKLTLTEVESCRRHFPCSYNNNRREDKLVSRSSQTSSKVSFYFHPPVVGHIVAAVIYSSTRWTQSTSSVPNCKRRRSSVDCRSTERCPLLRVLCTVWIASSLRCIIYRDRQPWWMSDGGHGCSCGNWTVRGSLVSDNRRCNVKPRYFLGRSSLQVDLTDGGQQGQRRSISQRLIAVNRSDRHLNWIKTETSSLKLNFAVIRV
jgi:hypothetical protein